MTTTTTQAAWDALPFYVREADTALGYPLRTWLSGVIDQYDDQANAVLAGYDLGDPDTTPRLWLTWLAEIGGVDTTTVDWDNLPESDKRSWLTDYANRRRGSVPSIESVVGRTLTGGQDVQVIERDGGDVWAVRVVVRNEQVVDIDDTTAAARRETPAWLVLTVQGVDSTTWQQLTDESLTWADVLAIGDWSDVLDWTP